MSKGVRLSVLFTLVLACGLLAATPAHAQQAAPAKEAATPLPAAATASGFDVLRGRWVRPDGGYVVTVLAVEANGQLDARYSNPHVLPFVKAEATREGKTIHVFLELQAGGYKGSTYTLAYDPQKDILEGVYYQAVIQKKFDVFFIREK
jgi:hypothetical protein